MESVKDLGVAEEEKAMPLNFVSPLHARVRRAAKPLSILGMARRIYTQGPYFVQES